MSEVNCEFCSGKSKERSEKEYKELEKARNNAAYLARLDLADEQIRQGKVVEKTMEELEAMATE